MKIISATANQLKRIPGGPIKTEHSAFSRICKKTTKDVYIFFAHIKVNVYLFTPDVVVTLFHIVAPSGES